MCEVSTHGLNKSGRGGAGLSSPGADAGFWKGGGDLY